MLPLRVAASDFIRSRRFCTACLTAKASLTPGFVCKLASSRAGTEVSVCSKGFSKSRFTHLGNTVASVGSVPGSTCTFVSASTCNVIVFLRRRVPLSPPCVCRHVFLSVSLCFCAPLRVSLHVHIWAFSRVKGLSVFQGFPVYPWGHPKQSVNTTAPRDVCQRTSGRHATVTRGRQPTHAHT